jgi:two-component system, NarL family, sensor histidine kinase UhpB
MSTAITSDFSTILVVDDSHSDYETYARYLERARPGKFRTRLLSAGRQLLSDLKERPECLLLDLSLPDISGLEILTKLKEQNGGSLPFPVIIVTGSGDETSGRNAVKLGAQDYLIKEEVTQESLLRAVEFAITRFRLEQQLRAGEDRYRRLSSHMKLAADAAELGYWSFERLSGAIEADQNNRVALGLPAEGALRYEDFLGAVFGPDRERLEEAVEQCLRTGVSYDVEFRAAHADGSVHWIASRGSVVRDAQGAITGMAGIAINVSERRHAEENYRALAESLESEVRLRTAELEARNDEVVRQAQELRNLSGHLLQVQDEERRRIARELHDSAGQILTALGMKLEAMIGAAQHHSSLFLQEAAETRNLVRQLGEEIRTMSYLLHPPLLDEAGLADALQWYIRGIRERSGLSTELTVDENLGRLPREAELLFFRLVQEGLTNIHRHSGSGTAVISIQRGRDDIWLEIQDAGRGMPPEKLREIQSQGGGVGIRGMRERIRPFGGHMNIELSFAFPLAALANGCGLPAERRMGH